MMNLTKLIQPSQKILYINLIKREISSSAMLDGIRILDLSRIIAGPYCTMVLGDMGAEIIKVERPGSGDEARKWGPPFLNDTKESSYFAAVNRNKKSICVDLKSKEGVKLIHQLAQVCDVLVENYVPGKLDKMNLGYEDLKSIAPKLIYCSITGYGSTGPYKYKPGYDAIAASVGGFLHITGPRNGEPIKAGVAVTDMATGLYAHGAILAALLHRNKTGKGQKIDCNLLSTQVASLINIGSNYLNHGKEAERWGTAHESLVPYEAFVTKDGYLTLGTGSDAQYKDLCKRIGKEELANDPKYKNNALRVENRQELISTLSSILKSNTNEHWMKLFEGCSFPCGPVNTLEGVFNDPHVKAIDLVKTVTHSVVGDIKVVGPPVVYSECENKVRSPPPTLGEHTSDILKNLLNYTDEDIDKLKQNKVVQ